MTTALYIAKRVPGEPVLFLIGYAENSLDSGQTLFTNTLPNDFSLTAHRFVSTIEEADFVLFPHAIKSRNDRLLPAVEEAKRTARARGKTLIVFVGGDLSHNIYIDDVIVLKGSQYKRLLRTNEIIVPPIAEDFADSFRIEPRIKGKKPVVSFCGWAGFPDTRSYIKYLVRNLYIDLTRVADPLRVVHKKGLYWRRRALRALSKDDRIDTRFIVRQSFSASAKTISLDPTIARQEYVENMRESDYVLAPKGDGNFSVRFYEALSMGRIPILVDTDTIFPFEDVIDYDSFIVRVPHQAISRIGTRVVEKHTALSDEAFRKMQQHAREAYTTYLRYDSFWNTLFSSTRLHQVQDLLKR